MRPRGVRLPNDVQRLIRSLHPDLKRRVRAAVDLLCVNPEAGRALKGELEGWRSMRVGRLRIVYREARKQIEVAAIGPRASIYFETARRLKRGTATMS
jgi:mRNA interferase RelE/StbE